MTVGTIEMRYPHIVEFGGKEIRTATPADHFGPAMKVVVQGEEGERVEFDIRPSLAWDSLSGNRFHKDLLPDVIQKFQDRMREGTYVRVTVSCPLSGKEIGAALAAGMESRQVGNVKIEDGKASLLDYASDPIRMIAALRAAVTWASKV